ncbi:MAG TPA: pyruvate dehydrogenase (acetyl-transferring) E1 component subunit alpha [Pyrinomonadaceae bacterium]|nr:pyruvate dehydrogenase (acetyl-transferring) E1 component subunit alpha [Pyrinomonadaceae bacterium]
MTKQSAAPPTAAGAEEQSSTGVIDPPPDLDKKKLAKERDQAKERQKDRFSGLKPEELIDLYRQMILIRRFEEKAAEVYVAGKIGGFCHLYIGQEAVAVGAISALRKDDYVLGSYREHGQALAKGMSARAVMAELYGKVTGCSKGKGGSMHMFDKELNFLGGHAIVGGQIPLATGLAFASMYQGKDQVTVCFFGEAAVNQGAFHESLNMAQLWKLPCIYICENNQYGMGTSLERAMSLRDIAQKACAFDMAAEFVDGMDVLAVREATLRAVERGRKQNLPTLLEIRTYRFMGHSMSDPGNYRTRAEIEKYQERDPIRLFVASLIEEKVADQAMLDKIDQEVREEVEDSIRFAEESPLPPPEDLYTDVYANPIDPARNKTR